MCTSVCKDLRDAHRSSVNSSVKIDVNALLNASSVASLPRIDAAAKKDADMQRPVSVGTWRVEKYRGCTQKELT